MSKHTTNTFRLGVFIVAGLSFLVLLLYVIGKNQNLFGKTFMLRARFENVHGLMSGNNIRFNGIDAGTVKSVKVINDTTIEVQLLIRTDMKNYLHKNFMVSIGTDGLMGNKLLNIEPSKVPSPLVEENDILFGRKGPDTDEILEVLNGTTNDIAVIAKELKQTVQRVNSSQAVWTLMNDATLPFHIRQSLANIQKASEKLNYTMSTVREIVSDINNGRGTAGQILKDTAIAFSAKEAIQKLKGIGITADSLAGRINYLLTDLNNEIVNGGGSINGLLKDKQMRDDLSQSFKNIEQGTKAFNENMEALKKSFLFRGYFRRIEKRKDTTVLRP